MSKDKNLNLNKENLPKNRKALPATVGLVLEVRNELKADIRSMDSKMESRFKKVDARFDKMEARFNEIDARFNKVDARFNEQDSKFKNQVALEALRGFVQKMDRIETRVDRHDVILLALAQSKRN